MTPSSTEKNDQQGAYVLERCAESWHEAFNPSKLELRFTSNKHIITGQFQVFNSTKLYLRRIRSILVYLPSAAREWDPLPFATLCILSGFQGFMYTDKVSGFNFFYFHQVVPVENRKGAGYHYTPTVLSLPLLFFSSVFTMFAFPIWVICIMQWLSIGKFYKIYSTLIFPHVHNEFKTKCSSNDVKLAILGLCY